MAHYNPNIERNAYCILAMNSPNGNFASGFTPVGPFASPKAASDWAKTNIINTPHDNPHWVVVRMMEVC